ncbi:MAG TPA: ferritin-like domain-containing protein [Kofleriaceae bacterium]|jgi:hypothetical protein
MTKSVPVRAGLEMRSLDEAHPVRRTVRAAIRRRRGIDDSREREGHAPWGAGYYGLDRVRLFGGARAGQRRAILEACGRALLEEAYFIEKCGIGYAAKMVLLAESSCERQLYGLIAGDEAAHLAAIARFVEPAEGAATESPFLALLEELVEEGDRASLQLIVQVVLEGWGLDHYRGLRDACGTHALKVALSVILADEASHHGSGVAFAREGRMSAPSCDYATDVMVRFLAMVQVGPVGVAGAVERELGGLGAGQRGQLMSDLGGEAHAAVRLEKIRALLGKAAGARAVLDRLDSLGCFRPLALEEAA